MHYCTLIWIALIRHDRQQGFRDGYNIQIQQAQKIADKDQQRRQRKQEVIGQRCSTFNNIMLNDDYTGLANRAP